MASIFSDTVAQLEKLRERSDSILVGFSGGKDSLVTMDLCCKTFRKVGAFFMYAVPGLEHLEKQMRFAQDRWGVQVAQIPHFSTIMGMKAGVYCDPVKAFDGIQEFRLKEAYAYAMHVTGIDQMAVGMKDADGLLRRQFFANVRDAEDRFWDRVHFPIRQWRKKDVLDYLKLNKIPVPESAKGAVTSGVGLDFDSVCWLHDTHPEDFKKFLKWFPYAEAEIKRREWYGIGAT